MKYWYLLASGLIVIGIMMVWTGCGEGNGGVNLAVVKGMVTDVNGIGLSGVTINSGTASTTSIADGSYTLSVAPGTGLKVNASKAGCVATFKVVSLTAGQTMPMDFSLNTVGQITSLSSLQTAPSTITDSRGTEVKLAADTIVDSTGASVDIATMDVTTALPSDVKFTENFPGLFIGTGKTGTTGDTEIESFGYVTIDITSDIGKKCNLRAGAKADIAIPVAAGTNPGSTIDLWSLDENTGKWAWETTATLDNTVQPNVYRAQISHFSAYNLDRPISQPMPFTITVKNSNGSTIAGASVDISSTNQTGGGKWEGRGITGSDGTVYFPQVPQGSVAVTVLAGSLAGSGYAYNVTAGAATMTVTLYTAVLRTFTAVYMNNGVETPIQNLNISVIAMGGGGTIGESHIFANGITNNNGQATLNLKDGLTNYSYYANTTINSKSYAITGSATKLSDIPDKWVLTTP